MAIARLKADQISVWLGERRADAEVIRSDRLLAAAVADLLAGRGGAATEADVRAQLAAIQEYYDYVDVVLVDRTGAVVVREPEDAAHALGIPVRALVRTTLHTSRAETTGLYLGASGNARLEMAAPVLADEPGAPAIAAVVLHINPHDYLYPLIQDWPLESASGETLVVQRRGDRVVFLNELRHRKDTALRLTRPLSDQHLPASMAVRGATGIVEGVDYRGVPVIAALEPVPDVRWFVIAKMDTAEVLGPIESRAWLTAGFTLLVVALAAAGTLLLWRARESQVTTELVASEVKFRSLFETMTEGVAMHELVRDRARRSDRLPGRRRQPRLCRQIGLRSNRCAAARNRRRTRPRRRPSWTSTPGPWTKMLPRRFESYFEPLDRHFQVSVVPQGGDRFATIVEDITERVAREQELRASERKFRETVESLDEGYYSVSLDGVLLDHNPAYCRILGIDGDADLRGQHTPDFWRHPTDRDRYLALLTSDGYARSFMAEAVKSDGSRLFVLLNAHLVRDESGESQRIEGTVVDFTTRKAAEEEVERLNAELEQRVFDRTAELDAANKELEAFAYSVSHDLRAPLRHVSGFSALLAERAGDGLDEKCRHYVDRISSSVREMGVLIDDLLQFSRTGRAELKIAAVDMDEVLAEALEPLRHEADGREIEWAIGPLPGVVADHALLRQVWANLLGNAVKYTRGRAPARIEVGAEHGDTDETGDVFFVRDNGVGFDMEYAHKLFGVFQRLHSAGEFEGTGIGLANVHRIVTRLGGRVWAEGALGQRCDILLLSAATEGDDIVTKEYPGILLAEDNPDDVELTLEALAAQNLANAVTVARDGVEALEYLRCEGIFADRAPCHPAVVLLDIKMPRKDGLEVLREIREDPALRMLPVVILTSSREEQDILTSYGLGVNAYVVKPVAFDSFMEAVREARHLLGADQ